jgi:hypothetical protein
VAHLVVSKCLIVTLLYRLEQSFARLGIPIARRKFFEAGDVHEAKEAMLLIGAMYAVEHEAERRGVLGTREHLALRREFSRVFFLHLLLLVRALRGAQGPKTLLGRAARYTWNNQRELALLYSLVVSCTRLGVNPVDYLTDVLNRIDKTDASNYPALLPDRWKPPHTAPTAAHAALFDA